MTAKIVKFQYTDQGVQVPSDFELDRFIRVYVDGSLLGGDKYTIANDGKGGRLLTLKDSAQEVCLAYEPSVGFTARKFSPEIIQELNDAFGRIEDRIAILQHQADKSVGGAICGKSGDLIINEINESIEAEKTARNQLENSLPSVIDQLIDKHWVSRKDAFYASNPTYLADLAASLPPMFSQNIQYAGCNTELVQDGEDYFPYQHAVFDHEVIEYEDGLCFYQDIQTASDCCTKLEQCKSPTIVGSEVACDGECYFLVDHPVQFIQEGVNV